jgi:hypothetical protein
MKNIKLFPLKIFYFFMTFMGWSMDVLAQPLMKTELNFKRPAKARVTLPLEPTFVICFVRGRARVRSE